LVKYSAVGWWRKGWGAVPRPSWRRWAARRGLGILLLAAAAGATHATQFLSPPDSGNRWIRLDWEPDAGTLRPDPIYDGNTVLQPLQEYSLIHGPGRPVLRIVFPSGPSDAFSYARGEAAIQEWDPSDGTVVESIPLGSEDELLDLSVHGSGKFLLAGLADGRVEAWDLAAGTPATFYPVSARAIERVAFFPGVTDPTDLRFATAGEDSLVRVWSGLGEMLFSMRVADGPTYALAVNQRSTRLIGAGAGKRIRIWNITSPPLAPEIRLDGHPATIRQVIVNRDGTRIASADESGQVRIWPFAQVDTPTAIIETGAQSAPPKLLFSVPSGDILFVGLADGRLQLYDGRTGQFLQEAQLSPSGVTSMSLNPLGTRVLSGNTNGSIEVTRAGRCVPSVENPICFGGYKIWRNTRPDTSGIQLLRVYNFGDSTWSFAGGIRQFQDPDSIIPRVSPPVEDSEQPAEEITIAGPHDGVSYFYSITRFDRHFLNGSVFDVLGNTIEEGFYRDPASSEPTAIVCEPQGRGKTPLLEDVYVVPNPYEQGDVPWDAIGGAHIEFRNLPTLARIEVYTLAGDLVRVVDHGLGKYGQSRSAEIWDLRNSQGKEVTSGVYLYQVKTPSGEVIQGYFAVIR
jgi:WD40 repeat protein